MTTWLPSESQSFAASKRVFLPWCSNFSSIHLLVLVETHFVHGAWHSISVQPEQRFQQICNFSLIHVANCIHDFMILVNQWSFFFSTTKILVLIILSADWSSPTGLSGHIHTEIKWHTRVESAHYQSDLWKHLALLNFLSVYKRKGA